MMLRYEDVVLRDMLKSDIEDNVRWFTTETRWSDFDAPWEPVSGDEAEERTCWTRYFDGMKGIPEAELRWKLEIEWMGRHVGWVSSYMIDEHYDWIAFDDIREGQTVHRAVGICICEPDVWNRGVGTKALRAFLEYYFDHGVDAIYTQTWSGNTRMLRCAEKLGFTECDRRLDEREVNGQTYDGLTFRLEKTT